MPFHRGAFLGILSILVLLCAALTASAQGGEAGAISGTVTDPSGAVVPNATVQLVNAMSGFQRTATTSATGWFTISNVPFNPYQIDVSAKGFAPLSQSVELRSAVGVELNLVLHVGAATQSVTVQALGPLVENTPTFHTDVDRKLFITVPLESQSSTLSSLVTETTPGVTADSNGLFHGLGDHASNSFSIDGEPITDQQSKVFSNQLPADAVASLEVIEGAPPAQYGDKTSLVIVATTRSGQGVTKPTGDIYTSYGSFGSATGGFNLSYGSKDWGNFIEMDGLDTGRFLDPPEFIVFHAKGNEENVFDHVDYTFDPADSIHTNFNYSRSWFQTPNSFDNLNVQNVVSGGASASPTFANVGNTDQRSQIGTFNFAPNYTRILNANSVLNFMVYVRRDAFNYYPSGNPLADLGPANLQTSSISQYRTLTNAGTHADISYAHGRQNLMAGIQYEQTFLHEHDSLGIVDNTYNSPCVDASGNPLPGYGNPSQCDNVTSFPNTAYLPVLAPYDLTRGGSEYIFGGPAGLHTDVKELAAYIEDRVTAGSWHFNLGLREDVYNGLTDANQTEPRLGVAYHVKPTNTVLGLSYARTLETPFNENLVLSSQGCSDPVLAPLLNCTPGVSNTLDPGYRNDFVSSVQQGFGKHLVVSGEYMWKYTHNAFDFSVLGNTPITFPIDWHNSKITGYALHAEIPIVHNFSAYLDASSVAARFFPPQVAGAGATVGQSGYPFRIDHDERFNETTHFQYTIPEGYKFIGGIWGGFNWRFDSGMVAGSVPCYNVNDPNSLCNPANGGPSITLPGGVPGINLSGLTPDEQFEAGLTCDGVAATPTSGFTSCPASELTSQLVRIPAPGTENDDHNPPRIAPRSLFDVTVGKNNIFNRDHYKVNLNLTAINITNKYALYNFLSTFSGTHYVTPRALTAKVTVNF
jgi:Carboxypeptidase regulatory-like domain/TonB-dependent Receptor Plug Domain